MLRVQRLSTALGISVIVGACSTRGTSTLVPAAETASLAIPISTQSVLARQEFMRGLRDLDAERFVAARQDFDRAVVADPNFAFGHLYGAMYAPSVAAYNAHLSEATRLANTASPIEQLWIRAEQKGYENDINGQRAIAEQLVGMTPNDPRALVYLANVQYNQGERAASRAALERATQISPNFSPAFFQLSGSYLGAEPRDPTRAESYLRGVIAREPNNPVAHDYMGDVYRFQNKLPEARAEYTRMTDLDPTRYEGFSQRGHVNSFLGNYADARADYDRAVALAAPVDKTGIAVFRGLVSVYEGNPAAAERELEQVFSTVDSWNIPNPENAKIGLLADQARVSMQNGHFEVAQRSVDRMRDLFHQTEASSTSEPFKRQTEANIAYWEGSLAARQGNYAMARTKAQEIMRLLAADQSPRKNEPAHELLGIADLLQGNYESAAGHLAQANGDDIFVTYNRALALEGAGRTTEAKQLYRKVADFGFNGSATALFRKEAARKAS